MCDKWEKQPIGNILVQMNINDHLVSLTSLFIVQISEQICIQISCNFMIKFNDIITFMWWMNLLPPPIAKIILLIAVHNGWHFANDIVKSVFSQKKLFIILLEFHWNLFFIDKLMRNKSLLVQVMYCNTTGVRMLKKPSALLRHHTHYLLKKCTYYHCLFILAQCRIYL